MRVVVEPHDYELLVRACNCCDCRWVCSALRLGACVRTRVVAQP